MRNWIDLCEKIVHRELPLYNPGDWLKTVIALNPTRSEFNSENFRQPNSKGGELSEQPGAAGVIMQNGDVVIGTGHTLAHHDIADFAGLDIENEKYRLQIWNGKVQVELWLDDCEDGSTLEERLEEVKRRWGDPQAIKNEVAQAVSRFTQWPVTLLLWVEYSQHIEY